VSTDDAERDEAPGATERDACRALPVQFRLPGHRTGSAAAGASSSRRTVPVQSGGEKRDGCTGSASEEM
jgi:hypothetical protein